MNAFERFLGECEGVTAIEYALLGSLIAMAIIVGVSALGINLGQLYVDLGQCVSQALRGQVC